MKPNQTLLYWNEPIQKSRGRSANSEQMLNMRFCS